MTQDTGNLTLWADRHAPLLRTIRVRGVDWRGAAFRLQVRKAWEANGDPLLDLTTVTAQGDVGVRLAAFAYDGVCPVSTIEIYADNAPIAAMPAHPTDPTLPSKLVWDLEATPSGGVADIYLRGPFKVRPGAIR
jgi:hypothetical protein